MRPRTLRGAWGVALAAAVAIWAPAAGGAGDRQAAARPSIDELWVEPERDRDLFHGVGGERLAPNPDARFTVIEIKVGGFSEGYTVVDPAGREWSTKLPPEAFTEVALSRIHWGLGYHQPPIYLMREWDADGATMPNPQLPARFRQKTPEPIGLDSGESWSFKDNPFVGTRQLAGLLVLQAIVENPDIKPSNNTVYTLERPREGIQRWFVVRDLGYSLGRATFNGPRADIEAYEQAPFIRDVVDGKVRFHYGGQYKALFDGITVADVHWICERLNRLSDRQWRDAFRAAAYDPAVADRYIKAIKARVAEGLALAR